MVRALCFVRGAVVDKAVEAWKKSGMWGHLQAVKHIVVEVPCRAVCVCVSCVCVVVCVAGSGCACVRSVPLRRHRLLSPPHGRCFIANARGLACVFTTQGRGSAGFQDTIDDFYSKVEVVPHRPGQGPSGALLLAVCRGKVSEGLDFKVMPNTPQSNLPPRDLRTCSVRMHDQNQSLLCNPERSRLTAVSFGNESDAARVCFRTPVRSRPLTHGTPSNVPKDGRARAVFVVGIPFPAFKDPQIMAKKQCKKTRDLP